MGRDAVEGEPREIELKLELETAHADRLLAHPLLKAGPVATASLRTSYFDTADLALREADISLRVRDDGQRRVQTLKAGRGGAAGLFDRAEWERSTDGDLDLGEAERQVLSPILADGAKLQPVFTLAAERRTFGIEDEAFAVELTLDIGVMEAQGRREPFCEVELELQRGAASELFRVAGALAGSAPLLLGIRTKADRGYTLLADEPPKAVKARDPTLQRGWTVAEAFQAIGRSSLRHLLENELVLRKSRDPEAVHQMRVALRRLRAAITLFRPALADSERDRIRAELKWMAGRLGEARDLDVMLAGAIRRALDAHPGDPDLAAVQDDLEQRREAAYGHALEAAGSDRFRTIVLDVSRWIEVGDWRPRDDIPARDIRERPAESYAADALARLRQKARKDGKHLARLSPEARHELRIDIKKLRYAAEFFTSLFPSDKAARRRESFLPALEKLQQHLGDLNDLAVSEDLLASLCAEEAGNPDCAWRDRAAALVAETQKARAKKLVRSAGKAFGKFDDAKKFWL